MKINTLRIKIHVFVTILFFHIFLMIGSITTTHHKTTIYTSKCNISWYHFNICSCFFSFQYMQSCKMRHFSSISCSQKCTTQKHHAYVTATNPIKSLCQIQTGKKNLKNQNVRSNMFKKVLVTKNVTSTMTFHFQPTTK